MYPVVLKMVTDCVNKKYTTPLHCQNLTTAHMSFFVMIFSSIQLLFVSEPIKNSQVWIKVLQTQPLLSFKVCYFLPFLSSVFFI